MREVFLFIFALGIFQITTYFSDYNQRSGLRNNISFIKIMKQRPIDDQGPSEDRDRDRNRDRNDGKKEREKEPKNQREMKDA